MVKLNSLLPEIDTFVKMGQNIVSSILAMRILVMLTVVGER